MINLKLIYKALGSLLFIEAFMMLLCLAMALFYGEDDVLGFTLAIILIVMTAFVLKFNGRASTNSMNRRDAYLLVTLTWIVFSLFGALPFVISGYIPHSPTPISRRCRGSPPPVRRFSTTWRHCLTDLFSGAR